MESLKDSLKGRVAQNSVHKPKIYSPMHLLAEEISTYCGEPKKFGLYLGIIKNLGEERTRLVFGQLKDSVNVKNPAKLFLYLTKKK